VNAQAKLKVAVLTHSTNPRGGVVHALELADALHDLGHEPVVYAPDHRGEGFFRATRCRTAMVPARSVSGSLASLVAARIEDYVEHFTQPGAERFDVYHAQDGISANALATLAERGVVRSYVRTVHHLDDFSDVRVAAWQRRGVWSATAVLCVSRVWQEILRRDYALTAVQVPNGVNADRYRPGGDDSVARQRLGLAGTPVFLSVGGVESRKNTVRLVQAFARVLSVRPWAQLVIAGGASLLDHTDYRAQFNAVLRESGIGVGLGRGIQLLGPVPDADMAALYRCADALVFPSVKEGFGLVVLEAMACGTPVVVSRIEPFTESLSADDCLWVDPHDVDSIAGGMLAACDSGRAGMLRQAGLRVSRRHSWRESARRHLDVYRSMDCPGEWRRSA
jgi:glycosyltransferase-like protein